MVGFAVFVWSPPESALVPVVIVGGLLVVGGLYFLWLLIFNREVLETEPGDIDVFKH